MPFNNEQESVPLTLTNAEEKAELTSLRAQLSAVLVAIDEANAKKEDIKQLQELLAKIENELAATRDSLGDIRLQKEKLLSGIVELDSSKSQKEKILAELDSTITLKENKIKNLETIVAGFDARIESLREEENQLISKLTNDKFANERIIKDLEVQAETQRKLFVDCLSLTKEQEVAYQDLKNKIAELRAIKEVIEKQVIEKDLVKADLEEKIKELFAQSAREVLFCSDKKKETDDYVSEQLERIKAEQLILDTREGDLSFKEKFLNQQQETLKKNKEELELFYGRKLNNVIL